MKPFAHAPVPVTAWEQLPGAAASGFFVVCSGRILDDMGCAVSGPHGTWEATGFGVIGCPVRHGSYDHGRPKGERVWIDSPDVRRLGSTVRVGQASRVPAYVQGWLCSALFLPPSVRHVSSKHTCVITHMWIRHG